MKKITTKLLAAVLSVAMLTSTAIPSFAAAPDTGYALSVAAMRTNSLQVVTTVDDKTPTFSWQIESNLIGAEQAAYQIQLTNAKTGEPVWDSGRVEDAASTFITYPDTAPELTAQTDYAWTVTVWDLLGKSVTSEPCQFSTGLMGEKLSAWKGAEWIGADELYLDADSLPVYRMNYTMQLSKGSTQAGFVFGANDTRLLASIYNNYLINGENYISYLLDTSVTPAVVNVYRVGYCPTDSADIPLASIPVDEAVINAENRYEQHAFEIVISGKTMESLSIDGQKVYGTLDLNPDNGTQLYPYLNDIGFVTGESSNALFSNLSVQNYREPQAEVFGENTGATYSIFSDAEGVSVDGGQISVDSGVLAYADPSYGSIPMLRKEFSADKEIESATLYATSRGIYEMRINGERVGDEYFTPGNTDYRQQIQYTSYDVTDMVRQGDNAIAATLASGWYSDAASFNLTNFNFYGDRQALLALMEITYTDGTTKTVVSDDSWQYYGEGPIRYAGNFNGETYDATRDSNVEGWDEPGFEADGWRAATEMESTVSGYEPRIVAKVDEGVKEVETLDATYLSTQTRGDDNHTVYIYDMGTNMVGVPEIKLPEGEAGQKITIRFAESIYPDLPEDSEFYYGDLANLILTENYRTALSTDQYIMKGQAGGEIYRPKFTFHGYRYIEISGVDEAVPAENIKGIVLSSVTEPASTYETSNELTNQLFDNIMRSTYGNHLSIATDCPQRDERLGWSGDAQVFSRTATYFADMNAFYRNFTSLQRDGQNKTDGVFAMFAPSYNDVGSGGTLGYCWSAAGVIVPYETYLQYGDKTLIEENYDAMKLHMSGLMSSKAAGKEYLTSMTGFLADHLSVVETNTAMLANATFYYTTCAMAEMASVMGYEEDAQLYAAYAEGIKAEWNATYVDPDTHKTVAGGKLQDTEASYSLPLAYNVFDDTNKPYAQQYLADACEAAGYTITTGFVGTAPLLPSLTDAGNIDEAYKMFEQTEYASWLYPVTQGATSIWERWNSYTHDNGYGGNNGMNSFNHYSLGAVGAWMMAYQVGIQRDETAGFKSFVLQPTPGGSFTYTNGSYESTYGTIVSNWTAENGALTSYEAVVPANTTATLYLPVSEDVAMTFKNIDGVTFQGMEEHNGQMTAKFSVLAGGYTFTVQNGILVAAVDEGYVSESTADKGILRSVLAYAEEQYASEEFDKVIASVQESFTAALENARAVDADLNAEQAQVDSAWQSLMTEIHKLGFIRGDKTTLGKLIEVANGYAENIERYTEATAKVFTPALEEAKAVYNDADAMQGEVREAESALLEAMEQLRYKADKTILEAVLAEANKVDTAQYTAETVAAFQAAKEAAEAVYGNDEATQQEINAAAAELSEAMNSLKAAETESVNTPEVQGDKTLTTAGGNAKTGETAPIAVVATLFALTGAGVLLNKKKK